MTDIKKCEHPDCNDQGARFIATSNDPKGKWLCYPHGDAFLKEK